MLVDTKLMVLAVMAGAAAADPILSTPPPTTHETRTVDTSPALLRRVYDFFAPYSPRRDLTVASAELQHEHETRSLELAANAVIDAREPTRTNRPGCPFLAIGCDWKRDADEASDAKRQVTPTSTPEHTSTPAPTNTTSSTTTSAYPTYPYAPGRTACPFVGNLCLDLAKRGGDEPDATSKRDVIEVPTETGADVETETSLETRDMLLDARGAPQAWGGFIRKCRSFGFKGAELGYGAGSGYLFGECYAEGGDLISSMLDLNLCLGNYNNHLDWGLKGGAMASCGVCKTIILGKAIIECNCGTIDLDEGVWVNADGQLGCYNQLSSSWKTNP